MSIRNCIQEINQAALNNGQELLEEEILDILDMLERRMNQRGGRITSGSQLDALLDEAREIAKQAKMNAAIQRRNRLINAKRYGNLKRIVTQSKDPSKSLTSVMVGSLEYTKDGRNSVDGQSHAIMVDNVGVLLGELQKNDVVELFAAGQLDELIYREMFDGVGSTGNKEAAQIAEAVQKVQKSLLNRKNRAGANISELRNYVVRQSHDAGLLRDAGFEAWKADILPLLDLEVTFKNLGPAQTEEAFLRGAYDGLVSGNHQKTTSLYGEDGKVDPLTAFKGPANLAKKLSAQRVLHFKDGKSAHQYARKYSRMTFSEAVLNGITHDAQSIALMEAFGTNPQRMFDQIIQDIKDEQKSDPDKLAKLNERALRNQFAELDGSTRAAGAGRPIAFGVDFAGISSGWRMIQNMSKLGMATISSISDVATKAAFIQTNTGRSMFDSYARALGDVFQGFNSKEQKELAYLLGVGVENFLGDVHARFGANDSGVGKIAKAHQFFFKAIGMQWWNDAQKTGLARMLAADLATYMGKSFDQIPEVTRLNLANYGITELEFGLFRGLDMKAVDGRDYLVPQLVEEISDDLIDRAIVQTRGVLDISDTLRRDYRDELRTKIANYYTDSADTAVPTPGARERAIMNQGTPRGTPLGEAIRAVMQLKGFPITYVTKGMSRQYYGRQAAGRSGYVGLAQMMTGTTVMGYLAMSMKDILRGREPREVFSEEYTLNPETLTSAFVQGGGAGIFGDFIFGEYNRYGQSLTQTLAGPTFGSLDDVARIYAEFREGDMSGGSEKSLNFALRNMPFANVFYARTALDYLFLYNVTDMMNPGYMKRMENRFEKETNQEFFFPPSQYAATPFD